jgi:hypothetical protein
LYTQKGSSGNLRAEQRKIGWFGLRCFSDFRHFLAVGIAASHVVRGWYGRCLDTPQSTSITDNQSMSWNPRSSDEKASALDDEGYDPHEDGIPGIWLC